MIEDNLPSGSPWTTTHRVDEEPSKPVRSKSEKKSTRRKLAIWTVTTINEPSTCFLDVPPKYASTHDEPELADSDTDRDSMSADGSENGGSKRPTWDCTVGQLYRREEGSGGDGAAVEDPSDWGLTERALDEALFMVESPEPREDLDSNNGNNYRFVRGNAAPMGDCSCDDDSAGDDRSTPEGLPCLRRQRSIENVAKRWGITLADAAELMANVDEANANTPGW